MGESELQALLTRLAAEVDMMAETSDPHHTHLEGLLGEITHTLANPRESNQDARLMNTLIRSVERLEVEHPRATGIVNEILVRLANMGI